MSDEPRAHANRVCSHCSADLGWLPGAITTCPVCGRPIQLPSDPDAYAYRLQEVDLPALEQAWAKQRKGQVLEGTQGPQRAAAEADARIGRTVPLRSRRFWTLATIVHFSIVVGVLVPVGMAVLSGRPLFDTRPAVPVESTSSRPSASVVAPPPAVGGLETGSVSKPDPNATPTLQPTPTPTPKPTPKPTPDRRRPTVASRTLGSNAVSVSGKSAIRILFSEPVRNVSGATIQLTNARGGWLVRSTVRYDAARRIATVVPDLWMYPNTEYRVTILPGITDRAGNRLAPTSWTFRTGSR